MQLGMPTLHGRCESALRLGAHWHPEEHCCKDASTRQGMQCMIDASIRAWEDLGTRVCSFALVTATAPRGYGPYHMVQGATGMVQGVSLNWQGVLLNWQGVLLNWQGVSLNWQGVSLNWQGVLLNWQGVLLNWQGVLLNWVCSP